MEMGTNNCESENVTCEDIKIELEIELHQRKESFEKAEIRLKQVEVESKQQFQQLHDLKSKVTCFSLV